MRLDRVALTLALTVAVSGLALAADDWEKEFAQGISKPESWNRVAAVKQLDPAIEKARDHLYTILEKHHWYLRLAAMDVLATATGGEALEGVRKDLKKHSSPSVREGIALAFGRMSVNPERANDLGEALSDKDERVRRAAAIAIGNHPTKEAVKALITAWEKEKESDVTVFLREALEKSSGKYLGRNVDDWKAWWAAVESDWQPPGGPKAEPKPGESGDKPAEGKSEDEKKAEEEGKKTSNETTTLRDVELTFKEAGKGGPLFILPEYGYSGMYFEKHLLALDDVARLFYIDLPGTSKFKGLKPVAGGLPEYPIDKLCEAFDELRKLKKQDRIAILAHGVSGWVAMRYATKYPRNVSHLILVSTWTSGKAWADGRDRAELAGKSKQNGYDLEFEHFAASCLIEGNGQARYSAQGDDESQALDRAQWTGYFTDWRSAYQMLFWPKVDRSKEMGGAMVPQFDVSREKGNPVPTLVFYGTNPRAIWTSAADMRQLGKCYPNASFIECPRSNRMPFIEDYDLFIKSTRNFFKKYPFKKSKT